MASTFYKPNGKVHSNKHSHYPRSHQRQESPNWQDISYLQDRLGFQERKHGTSTKPGTSILVVIQVLLFCCIGAAAVWSKLSFLSLVAMMKENAQEPKPKKPVAFAAVCLAIFCPYVWNFLWKLWRTPILEDPLHEWPRGIQLAFIILTALLEASGISIFALVVCPNISSLLALGMMCLVFCLPRGHVWAVFACFRPRIPYQRVEIAPLFDPEHESNLHAHIHHAQRQAKKRSRKRMLSLLGSIIQFIGIGAIPVFALVLEDKSIQHPTLIAWLAPASILLLSFAWWPVLHSRIGLPQPRNTRRYDESFGPVDRIQANPAMRGSLLSLFLRCTFSVVAIIVVSLLYQDDCKLTGGKCEFWNDLILLGSHQYLDELVCLLGLLLCSFVAYNGARYSMMMGLQLAGFAVPFSLTPLISAGIIALNNTVNFSPANLHFETLPDRWWIFLLFVILTSASSWLCSRGYTFVKRIPRLALDETLFYQSAYNAVFVDQFALISRRSSSRNDAVEDGDAQFVLSTEEVLTKSTVFVCTTMYNEKESEMEQLLRSVVSSGVHLAESCKFQHHIFMDGGMQSDNEPGFKALQLIRVLKSTIENVLSDANMTIQTENIPGSSLFQTDTSSEATYKRPRRILTPYGARLEFPITTHFSVNVHLKDGKKVRAKKRWSQVMYMFYITRFILDHQNHGDSENAYILATDADIKFQARDVIALLMMIARDKSVGAVCGRTYPMGTGPLVWYQHFDYAIGHWFQKAAEHVLGSVLCCPGCFSMFRVDALREVVLEYSTHVSHAFEFLTKDMGEDRWLCTLLVTHGWRLEYCAAAKDQTFCPDSLKDFFNQRRRWIVSTVANMFEILRLGLIAVRRNPSVSYAYIAYTALMLVSTVVRVLFCLAFELYSHEQYSPATVILVMIGGFSYILHWNLIVVEVLLFSVTIFYIFYSLYNAKHTVSSFLVEKILTAVFAIIMCLVFVGLLAQIADDIATAVGFNGTSPTPTPTAFPTTSTTTRPPIAQVLLTSPDLSATTVSPDDHTKHRIGIGSGDGDISMSSVYLLTMVGMFFIAGFMHLGEFTDLVHGVWYLICLPIGYLILLLYACCHLNDRSWGTRTVQQETARGASTRLSGRWWEQLFFGCGLQPNESFTHFFGRILCCNRYDQVQDSKSEEKYALQTSTDESPLPWQLVPHVTSGTFTEYHVECLPVKDAILALQTPEKDESTITERLRDAVLACPMLIDGARQRDAAWCLAWNSELNMLESDFMNTVLNNPDVAGAVASDFELTMEHMTEKFRQLQAENHLPLQQELLTSQCIHQPIDVAEWVHGLKCQHEMYVTERFQENGFENSVFISYLEECDLFAMGIDQLPNGKILIKRIMQQAQKAKTYRPVVQLYDTLEQWLDSLELSQYLPHFTFFDINSDDVQNLYVMNTLNEKRFKEIGIVKLGHHRRITEALNALLKRLKDANEHGEFWIGFIGNILSPTIDTGMDEIVLKRQLDSLRDRSVLAMVILNTVWLVFMLALNGSVADHLHILGTNPLGVMFILTYGSLFALQFLTMFVHRFSTFVQYIATISVDRHIGQVRSKAHRETELSLVNN